MQMSRGAEIPELHFQAGGWRFSVDFFVVGLLFWQGSKQKTQCFFFENSWKTYYILVP